MVATVPISPLLQPVNAHANMTLIAKMTLVPAAAIHLALLVGANAIATAESIGSSKRR